MLLEETIDKLLGDRKADYTLVDIRRLALPFTRIKLSVRTQEKHDLSVIDEFVLKASASGLNKISDIQAFLGLPDFVFEKQLSGLILERNLAPSADGLSVAITNNGKTLLANGYKKNRSNEEIEILQSKLTNEIFPSSQFAFLRPKDVREDCDITQIDAAKGYKFAENSINLDDLQFIINKYKRSKIKKQVLQIGGIKKKDNGYAESDLWIFSHIHTGSNVFKIILSDEESKSIEESLGKLEFYNEYITDKKSPEHECIDERFENIYLEAKNNSSTLNGYTGKANEIAKEIDKLINDTRQEQVSAEISECQIDPKREHELENRIKELENQKIELEKSIKMSIRFIKTYEHPKYFDDALANTTNRLIIISPWITRSGMKESRLTRILELLKAGVKIYIGYGIDKFSDENIDLGIVEKLNKFKKQFPNTFTFVRLGNTHSKILASDDNFFITGSFNWMSFAGEMRKGAYRDESSVVLSEPNRVTEMMDKEIAYSFNRSK